MPFCIQCSYLLSIVFKVDSITNWIAQPKINPFYAILSGFEFGNTLDIGTFYDFFDRLWDSDADNLSPHEHPVKKKKVKKLKTTADSIEKLTVAELLPVLPLFLRASKHDSHSFLHTFFRMKAFHPDYKISKVILDSAHDTIVACSVTELQYKAE